MHAVLLLPRSRVPRSLECTALLQVLYKLLSSLSADQEVQPGSSEPVRSKPGAGALCRMEERGSTMLYRMPIWLYDDDE